MRKNILVTGGANGIGKGIAEHFSKKDFNVFIIDLEEVKSDFSFCCDVSSFTDLENVFNDLKKRKINLDIIVNNAAVQIEKTLLDTTEDEWDKVLNVNLKSIFLTTKIFKPILAKKASIINIASVHSRATSKGLAAYVASKGGVASLTRAMALELAEFEIRVNSVHPGAIDTPMLEKGLGRSNDKESYRKKLINSSPLKQIGNVNDVANLVGFLCDNNTAGNITGQEFFCDSGIMAKLASE